MKNKLITVIVPIYKVEKYLNKCVESIVNQTYTNLEIILVDDGSPDNCPQMCDEWAKKDSRIKVIHKQNGGLSDARNAGMSVAAGEYIGFVDSDDWIHEDFFALLYQAILDNNSNLSACDIDFVYDPNVSKYDSKPVVTDVYSVEDALNSLIHGVGFRAVAWNKLYHKDLLHGESFEVGKYHEDEFFTYRILAKSVNPVFLDAKLYYYFQRDSGIVNSVSERHLDALDAYLERLDFLKIHFPKLYTTDKLAFCKACINLYQYVDAFPDDKRQTCRSKILNVRSAIKFSLIEIKVYSIKDLLYIIGSDKRFINAFVKILSSRR